MQRMVASAASILFLPPSAAVSPSLYVLVKLSVITLVFVSRVSGFRLPPCSIDCRGSQVEYTRTRCGHLAGTLKSASSNLDHSTEIKPIHDNELLSSSSVASFASVERNRGSTLGAFVREVISFLDEEDIRHCPFCELRHVLETYALRHEDAGASQMVDGWMSLLKDRTILLVGRGDNDTLHQYDPSLSRNSFVLHLCPTLRLTEIDEMYRQSAHYNDTSNVSQAVASYARLNAMLTDAISQHKLNSREYMDHDTRTTRRNDQSSLSIVHLHQDVWNRSPDIVKSRLRSKCGIYRNDGIGGRIYARNTVVRRISRSEYLPFLGLNHLWGATSSKYAFGLYLKRNNNRQRFNESSLDSPDRDFDNGILLAVATFSARRKMLRANRPFHSYELLRFCTKRDTAIVGGLTKLVSAFFKEVHAPKSRSDVNCTKNDIGVDIITSIDRDFGSSTWPNFTRMEVMDPLPMFVGEFDGIRRHAVGAGVFPLDQQRGTLDKSDALSASELLRAGLPSQLMEELNCCHDCRVELPWKMVERYRLHPVFDAGVERLMYIKDMPVSGQIIVADDGSDSSDLSLSDLWKKSVPSYTSQHYSPNRGIEKMLHCIRHQSLNL